MHMTERGVMVIVVRPNGDIQTHIDERGDTACEQQTGGSVHC